MKHSRAVGCDKILLMIMEAEFNRSLRHLSDPSLLDILWKEEGLFFTRTLGKGLAGVYLFIEFWVGLVFGAGCTGSS